MCAPSFLASRCGFGVEQSLRNQSLKPLAAAAFFSPRETVTKMHIASKIEPHMASRGLPRSMKAAVYRGKDDVCLETVPVPEIGPGELLVRVRTCGICGTDLKKIATGSHAPPRIFGHEIAGQIVAAGESVRGFSPGDRVMVFHHIP